MCSPPIAEQVKDGTVVLGMSNHWTSKRHNAGHR